jgi:Zn-dependent protease with chaperone function
VLAELLRHPLVPWLATYLAHSTILCAAAWGFDLWTRDQPARERTLGPARERLWKFALFLPLFSTLVQCAGGISLWQLPQEAREAVPALASPLVDASTPALAAVGESAGTASAVPLQIPWAWVAAALWLAGVACAAFSWWREWLALGRAVRGLAACPDPGLQAEFDALRAGDPALERTSLHVGRQVLVPLTLGWSRMRVVVPLRATLELGPDERRALLAHELAHARRRDPLWISAARAVEGLFCFQPLNRLARIKLQDEAEFLADRWAIGRGVEPLSLASCLTEVAGWIVSNRRSLPVPSMAARGARLTRRVERLLEERRAPLPLRSAPWSLAFLALALGSAAAAVPGQAPRMLPVHEAPAPSAAPDDLAAQFTELAAELDLLAAEAEQRELDPRWHRRFTELRNRLANLRLSYTLLVALAKEAPPAEPQPKTDP